MERKPLFKLGARCVLVAKAFPPCECQQRTGTIVHVANPGTRRDPDQPEYLFSMHESDLRYAVKEKELRPIGASGGV